LIDVRVPGSGYGRRHSAQPHVRDNRLWERENLNQSVVLLFEVLQWLDSDKSAITSAVAPSAK
jgi:hypothetical protein